MPFRNNRYEINIIINYIELLVLIGRLRVSAGSYIIVEMDDVWKGG